MFRKLFAARPSHSPVLHHSSRPELESLEDRLAPVFFSTGPFPDDLMGNLQTTGPSSFPAFPAGTSVSLGSTGFSSAGFLMPFSSASAGFSLGTQATSAGFSLAPQTTGVSGGASTGTASAANQLAQLQQMIGPLFQMAAAQNAPAAVSLVIDEVFLAIDTNAFFQSEARGVFSPAFQSLPARENAINQNPLELTPVGRLLGSMVFEATADLIASTQPGAGTAV
jgi:hypothetical protein